MPVLRLQPDLEQALCQLPGVRAVSIVTGPDAQPVEVHVLSSPGKPAKQVVRDVQSLSLAQFDIDIDHRIVSVVQIGESPEDASPAHDSEGGTDEPDETSVRPSIGAISSRTGGGECQIEVVLHVGEHEFTGSALGPSVAHHRSRIVAAATLSAAKELLGVRCEVESAHLVSAGTRQVALSVLSLAAPRGGDQVVTGSALVRGDDADAVARSVLNALNRQLSG